ncbi:MAG TPA: sulfite exporter TauE/SafE family protein [Methylophilaceae bacterium]|jgi:uncharacterized membrane protein YfcA
MNPEFLLYLAAGAAAGILSGLFGVGGGLIIVSILTLAFSALGFAEANIMHLALGTSLATIVLTSISSARAHHRLGNVNWQVVQQITPGIIIGTLLGAILAAHLNSLWLKGVFAVFVFGVATQLLLNIKPAPHRNLPRPLLVSLMGAIIGVVSSLVGIGGGTLSVPFLIHCNTDTRHAIGTSAAIGLPIAVAGTVGYIYTGVGVGQLPPLSLGFVYLPAFAGIAITSMATAPFGAALAQRLPVPTLKRLFALLLYIVGAKMLWGMF